MVGVSQHGKLPTVKEVAQHAGVSPMTVSRTLAGGANVRPDLQERVLAAVRELGYRRNENARTLRPGQASGLIGVAITNLGNPYYGNFALGVEEAAAETGRRIVLGQHRWRPGARAAARRGLPRPAGRGPGAGAVRRPIGSSAARTPRRRAPRARIAKDLRARRRCGAPRRCRRRLPRHPRAPRLRPHADRLSRQRQLGLHGHASIRGLPARARGARHPPRSRARLSRTARRGVVERRDPASSRSRRAADRDLQREQPQQHRRAPRDRSSPSCRCESDRDCPRW